MEKIKKSLIILNLAGELSQEFNDYISTRNIKVVNKDENLIEEDWTHIITRDVHNFELINATYDVIDKNRSIISLSSVEDLQNFSINNGNLILDNLWFKDGMGPFIMDKYFQGYGGLTLGDNYPAFKEVGSFKVTNPFNTGEYLDRMTHNAFENGIDALTLKTYFDHLIMYLAGLKKKGKAGLPFEIMYGSFNDIYAVQINFFSQDLQVIDVAASLSSKITRKAEEYLLNTAVQSTDFFDFSYLPEVKKVSITAFWTKDERIKFENRGLMFMSLVNGATLSLTTNKIEVEPEVEFAQIVKGLPLDDFTEKISIPDTLPEDPFKTIVSGVKAPTDDEVQLLKGGKILDDVMQTIKGKLEEDKASFRVLGSKLDVDQASFKIAASVNESAKENKLKVRSLEGQLPGIIKSGLFDFAKGLNKAANDLDDDELVAFHLDKMPEILREGIKEQINTDQSFELKKLAVKTEDEDSLLKGSKQLYELVQTIQSNFEEEKDTIRVFGHKLDVDKTSFVLAATVDKSVTENNLQIRSLGEQFPQKVKTGLFDFAKGINKDVVDLDDFDLSKFQTNKMPKIIQEEISSQIVSAKSALALDEKAEHDPSVEVIKNLKNQIHSSKTDNEKLKNQLAEINSELKLLKGLKEKTSLIEAQIEEEVKASETSERDPLDENMRSEFELKLRGQAALTAEDMIKISSLLEAKAKLLERLKVEESNNKKIQLSSVQKENYLNQEISKGEKQVKNKNLMLVKTKETFTRLLDKKESEAMDLRNKVEQLTKHLASASNLSQSMELSELEKKNQHLEKQIESYQAKNIALQKNLLATKQADNSKDEVRKLQSINQQIKTQQDVSRKQIEKLVEKHSANLDLITTLKAEKSALEQLLSKAATQKDKDKEIATQPSVSELELKRLKSQNQILETQFKDAVSKIAHTESKLIEALKVQKASAVQEDASKPKPHLEASVKKLGQDLTESKNQLIELKKETNKLRQDKIALQNQLDKVKKDAEKAKPVAPAQKTGGKAA